MNARTMNVVYSIWALWQKHILNIPLGVFIKRPNLISIIRSKKALWRPSKQNIEFNQKSNSKLKVVTLM